MSKELSSYLFWLDLEMTGLDHDRDTILEISSLLTDNNLSVVAQGPTLQIKHLSEQIEAMDEWNKKQHKKSGLIDLVQLSEVTIQQAELATLNFVSAHCAARTVPLCGNSIYQDRFFLCRLMPKLEAYLHYHVVDVSSVKELVNRWYKGQRGVEFKKAKKHRAADDVIESIEELAWYRSHFFIE